MKKIIAILLIIICLLCFNFTYSLATSTTNNSSKNLTESKLVEIKDKELKSIEDYKDAYGSDTYGMTAYVLNKVRIYSIPLAFIAIAIGAIYQFVLGIRKMDVRDKGFKLIIASITLLVICQVLPLVFAIVVRGWRG